MTTAVAIRGAGPAGLAAAAHGLERGIIPLVCAQGNAIGHAIRARRPEAESRQRPEPHPSGADLLTDDREPPDQSLAAWVRPRRRVVAIARGGIDQQAAWGAVGTGLARPVRDGRIKLESGFRLASTEGTSPLKASGRGCGTKAVPSRVAACC